MKLVSCLLLFFLIQMYNTKHSRSSKKIVRIPLKPLNTNPHKKGNVARAQIPVIDSFLPHVGNITVGEGSNSRNFQVIFDTVTEKSWLYSKEFHSCEKNFNILEKIHPTRYVGPSVDSDTTPVFVKHFPGWVYGLSVQDTLAIGTDKTKIEILEVKKAHTGVINQLYDGVVGLRYNPQEGNAVSKFCESIDGENKFAFYFTKNRGYGEEAYKAEFEMCGADKEKYTAGTMYYNKVINPGQWEIMLTSVQLNGADGVINVGTKVRALVDPRSSMIIGPAPAIDALFKKALIERIPNTDAYHIRCELVPNLPYLQFQSITSANWLSLSGEDYTRKIDFNGKQYCRILLRKTFENKWTFGDIFIRKYYTVFDMEKHQIGFGRIE